MKIETQLPLGNLDPGLRAAAGGLDLARVGEEARLAEALGYSGIVTEETKKEMKRVLNDIQSGKFARDWMLENKVNQTSFKATRAKLATHPIEEIGAKLRDMMPWIKKGALVDKTKN